MIEGTEEKYAALMERMMEAMVKLVEDPKASPADRVAAAKVVDGANDSLIKSKLLGEVGRVIDNHDAHAKDMLREVKDLKNHKEPWED
jgi:hypothetical protein